MIKHQDDLSVVFPMINYIEDSCVNGKLMELSNQQSLSSSSSSSSSSNQQQQITSSISKGDVYLVDYSDKTVAVFGNTRIIKVIINIIIIIIMITIIIIMITI